MHFTPIRLPSSTRGGATTRRLAGPCWRSDSLGQLKLAAHFRRGECCSSLSFPESLSLLLLVVAVAGRRRARSLSPQDPCETHVASILPSPSIKSSRDRTKRCATMSTTTPQHCIITTLRTSQNSAVVSR